MILLSFDTEEFDVPREHGVDFPLDEAMKVSVYGTTVSYTHLTLPTTPYV